jgi:phosphate transport system protein
MPNHKDVHTVKRFDQELGHLRGLIMEMGGLVEEQINQAVTALYDEDIGLARQIIERDHKVNALEVKADEEIANIIALRQPMASDLRMIMALSKTVTDLERNGDEAERIAQMIVRAYNDSGSAPQTRLLRDILQMSKLASDMLHGCLDALARLDVEQALRITKGDRELDEAFSDALRRLATFMMEDPRTIGHAINVIFIIRSLERIGDHSKNIAEYVVYLVKGKDIRHVDVSTLERNILNDEDKPAAG